jgi:hypothetical protein
LEELQLNGTRERGAYAVARYPALLLAVMEANPAMLAEVVTFLVSAHGLDGDGPDEAPGVGIGIGQR